jgi:hypothetical protein
MVGGPALSQILTLDTTPVVYLYLARLQAWLERKPAKPAQKSKQWRRSNPQICRL